MGCNEKKETVTLRYAAWNLGSIENNGLERRMIKAFMEAYPYINVKIDEAFVDNYDQSMKAAAAARNMPDVFMYANNPQANSNGWCADITDIAGKDREWENIPLPLREAAKIRGRIIALPSSMYLYGYFVNESLFKENGKNPPKAGQTIEEFKNNVKGMTVIDHGSIGLADESSIIEWYPAAVNPLLGWYSWDGGRFNLNSKEFKEGIKLARSIYQSKQTYASLSEDEKKSLKGTNDWEAWNSGMVALKFDGTWAADDYSRLPFKVDFMGIPGGRVCIVPDFQFISKESTHPVEAYKFIKYMSAFSREGFSKRMELAKANNLVVTSIPMIKDKKLVDAYFANIKTDGIQEMYDMLDKNSYVEGTKVLPGYIQARWDYVTNIKAGDLANAPIGTVITDTFRGSGNIDEIAANLNSAANECVQIYPGPADN
jgi:multiple sugar transport system substrate-binding protein